MIEKGTRVTNEKNGHWYEFVRDFDFTETLTPSHLKAGNGAPEPAMGELLVPWLNDWLVSKAQIKGIPTWT